MKLTSILLMAVCISIIAACAEKPLHVDKSTGVDSPAAINAKLGLSYMQHGNYDVALAKLKKALKEEPRLVEAHHYIAELYRLTGDNELANEHFRTALELDPNDSILQHNFGVFLCDQGKYDEAERHILIAVNDRKYPRPDEALQNAGLCLMRKPDYAAAEQYFRRALAINKNLPSSLYQLAVICYRDKRYLNARAFIERYGAIAKPTPQSLWLGVQIERALGGQKAADHYADMLLTKFPDSEETRRLQQIDSGEPPSDFAPPKIIKEP